MLCSGALAQNNGRGVGCLYWLLSFAPIRGDVPALAGTEGSSINPINLYFCPMRKNLNNLESVGEKRKELRSKLTPAEATLWTLLKNKQLAGRKFRRQFSVGSYILDFYCHNEKLAVELDGAEHFTEERKQYDEMRDAFIEKQGIRVIRIENKKVFDNTGQVLDYIQSFFKD